MTTALRRSTRSRRPVDTKTPKEKEDDNKRKRSKSRERSASDKDGDDDNETLVSHASHSEEEMMDEDDSDDSDVEEEKLNRRPRKRKSPTTTKARKKAAKKKKSAAPAARGGAARGRHNTALSGMAKKIASDGETPENSLALALLLSFKQATKGSKNKNNSKETIYTAQLQKIAQGIIEQHDANANKAQVALLNLIFRSIGGSFQSFLDAETVDLEEGSDDDLGELIDVIVNDMEDTSIDCTLLPIATAKTPSVATQEYRKIFQEFWYQLGTVALSGTVVSSSSSSSKDNSDDSDSEDESSVKKSARFQVELVRDILSRLVEISQVGLADIRAAVSTAVYSIAVSVLEKTVQLKKSLETAQRQLHVAKRSKSTRKAEALEIQIGSWKRTLDDLESIATETVVRSVFLHRYRDVNPQIRASSAKALSEFSLIRPDQFLCSTYLKYFGWLLSDKDAVVRAAAISALLAPFQAVSERHGKSHNGMPIDLEGMNSVLGKFLSRLADCVIDVDVHVQETAMELLLVLLRQNFFDEVENDRIWEQINMRSIDPDTSPAVRRDALYFVMDQLEAFDNGTSASERDAVERLYALVDWIAHSLSDGDIPLEGIRYDRADLVIRSLRSMPENKPLVCNWSAMLRVLQRDDSKRSGRKSISKGDQRIDTVKQRVLLRMLTAAAKMELVDATSKGTLAVVADPDVVDGRNAEHTSLQTSKQQKKNASTHEELTLALLGALPDLLTSFKSEALVLQNLTSLPQYFLPSVLNLSSRKKDFHALVTNLANIFLESTDQTVLENCSVAIVSLAKGKHARSNEALLRLKEMAGTLRDRLLELLDVKSKQTEDGSDDDENEAPDVDLERSISLCLRRLVVLSKHWSLAALLSEAANETIDDEEQENICSAVTKYIGKELKARQSKYHAETEDDADIEIAKIWETADEDIHSIVAESVSEGLEFLLTMTAWRLKQEIECIENSDDGKEYSDEEIKNHLVIHLRDWLSRLIILCYEQYVGPAADVSETHLEFAEAAQNHAVRVSGDLRQLFPREWSKAVSPFLSACALIDDGVLIGAGVRFVRSQENKIRDAEEGSDEKRQAIEALLFPLARGLCPNWETGNRKEAGAALAHIAASGKIAHNVAQSISRALKKIQPVRLLEAHMACLRQDFETWAESEPEELGDRPTDAEMAQYEADEAAHEERFEFIQNQASRLASSLGVGKLHDERLARALLGFVREGVRFAFSTYEADSEEELALGIRLPFLRILNKYLNWIRRHEGFKEVLKKELNEKETQLRNQPEYDEVLEDDLMALAEFRESGDLGDFVKDTDTISVSQLSTIGGTTPGSRMSRSRVSLGGTTIASSIHGLSTQGSVDDGSLESIQEEPAENDADSTPSPQKRRKTTVAKSDGTTKEANDDSSDDGALTLMPL